MVDLESGELERLRLLECQRPVADPLFHAVSLGFALVRL
jgi:hypothetical protein